MPKPSEKKFKLHQMLRPLVRPLSRVGMSVPLLLTIMTCLSATAGLALASKAGQPYWLLVLPAAVVIRIFFDALVDAFPHEQGAGTSVDAVMKELAGVLSDAALYSPLAIWPGFTGPLVMGMVILSVISELAGSVAVQIGVSRRYDGPMTKLARAIIMGSGALLYALGIIPLRWYMALIGSVMILLVQTIWNRARRALKETVS